ncbi:homoserine kinase [uncultured Limosilactobacillus sp.]|uniref:homoserine kinase n=1 Tax=uncultured Limosilactobacillus sp. TaxID=2837629 RepID=UPI0025FAE98F|nr:homoserine kinase [uncultured Limosilactobacillus sp.]
MEIQVPASSANLGPGFDSIGIAVSLYLHLTVVKTSNQWQVDHQLGNLPHDQNNMIVKTALKVAPNLKPHHLRVQSDIPVTHGLGSSSSAIVAGIELANQLAHLQLSNEAKVEIASQFEGHPDNVAPAILGGLVVGTNVNDHFAAVEAPLPPFDLVAYIPAYNLATKKARAALPHQLDYQQATHASAVANTLVASLFSCNYQMAGELIEADEFHEQYRASLVPELVTIRNLAHQNTAVATYLSGAGPTVMTILPHEQTPPFIESLRGAGLNDRVEILHPDQSGVIVN